MQIIRQDREAIEEAAEEALNVKKPANLLSRFQQMLHINEGDADSSSIGGGGAGFKRKSPWYSSLTGSGGRGRKKPKLATDSGHQDKKTDTERSSELLSKLTDKSLKIDDLDEGEEEEEA